MSCVQSRPESLFQNKWFIEWSCCYLNHKWTKSDNITELFFLIHPVLMWSLKCIGHLYYAPSYPIIIKSSTVCIKYLKMRYIINTFCTKVIPGRMTLLITIFLVLINIFNTIQTNSPQVTLCWLLIA